MLDAKEKYPVKGEWIRNDILKLVNDSNYRYALSLGCGTASTEEVMQKSGIEVWGVDFIPEALSIAEKRIAKVIPGDLEENDFKEIPKEYFDLILCTDVLEHLRYVEAVLQKIKMWLKPEGQAILSVPNSCHYSVFIELFLHRDWKYRDGGLFDEGHYRMFTRKSICRLLEDNNFRIIEMSYNKSLPSNKILRFFSDILSKHTVFGKDIFSMQVILKVEKL